jgi:hypothetical protein
VALEGNVETGLVDVERVRVLHDELAEAEQCSARRGSSRSFVEKWYQTCGSCL